MQKRKYLKQTTQINWLGGAFSNYQILPFFFFLVLRIFSITPQIHYTHEKQQPRLSMGQFCYLKLSWKILSVNLGNCNTIFEVSERVGNTYLGSICVQQCCLVLVQGVSQFQFTSRLGQLVQRPPRPPVKPIKPEKEKQTLQP